MSDATTILDDVQIDNLGDDGYEEVDIDVTLMTHQNEEDEEEEEEEEEEFTDEDDTEVEDDVELEVLFICRRKVVPRKSFVSLLLLLKGLPHLPLHLPLPPTIDPTQNSIPTSSPPFHNHALPNTRLSTIQPTHLSFGHVPTSTTTPIGIPTPITTPETSQPSQEVFQPIEDVQRQTKMKIFPRGKEFYPNHTHRNFCWDDEHAHEIRRVFEFRGSSRLKGMTFEIRKSGKQPMWLSKDVYDGLYAYWESKEFKGKITHSTKKDQSFVDQKSKEAYEKYTKRLSEIQASTQGEGSTSQGTPLPQLSMEIQMTIWKEVVDLTKKGKIFRFGKEDSCASTTEKQSKKKLKKRLHRVKKKLSETTKLVKTLIQ
ncbi:hypothetical protein Cgig2_013400 [Carnegiea gigantea]|uniref:Transposase n=1 Tax=Carnegiea gigantea TaxID=171969 RepID=A0A9Q1KDD0_9CARY|nr:hypothetical protein Cgig2_013400 [Carnegiea gigantea]